MPAPVLRLPLPRWIEPAAAWRVLAARHPHVVWSDAEAAPGPRRSFVAGADEAHVLPAVVGPDPAEAVLDALDTRLQGVCACSDRLGWWGWLGYEAGAVSIGAPAAAAESPAAAFLLASAGVEFDHDARTAAVVALPGRHAEAAALRDLLLRTDAPRDPPALAASSSSWRHGRERYLAMVEACRRSIAAGDAYQLCLTNRVDVVFDAEPDPLAVFLRLRAAARVPAALLLRIDGWTLVSASPETFLTVDAAGRARSRPIKGTRPRGADPAADAVLAAQLRDSEKERAENLMIVDLVRNDLARVAAVGSVRVTGLFDVEAYPAVHQLVSTVEADVRTDPVGAVRALFPAGSMTGAPKRSAVTLLHALEQGPRGLYAGAAGRLSADGTIDLAVVIRSIVLHGRTATIGTGGGITILSEPEEEWAEIRLKAAALLRALGVREDAGQASAAR